MVLILGIICFTFIYGSMAGWIVHWLLHTKYAKTWGQAHNTHHKLYPIENFESEEYRSAGKNDSGLVFVPIITGAIVLMCVPLWFIFQTWWLYPIIFVVGITIGWLNDYLHKCFHISEHSYNKYKWFRKLKDLHYIHHKFPKRNHGIIWFGSDRLFKTFRDKK